MKSQFYLIKEEIPKRRLHSQNQSELNSETLKYSPHQLISIQRHTAALHDQSFSLLRLL